MKENEGFLSLLSSCRFAKIYLNMSKTVHSGLGRQIWDKEGESRMKGRSFGQVVLLGGGYMELELLEQAFSGCERTRCTVFYSAEAALHYLKTTRVDVTVVDCLSIEMDIFAFLREARKLPGNCTCRIVVAGPGGYAENVRIALLSKGADYYMIKPYKADALFESIESLAPGHRLAWVTPWDAAILRRLERLGAPDQDAGY